MGAWHFSQSFVGMAKKSKTVQLNCFPDSHILTRRLSGVLCRLSAVSSFHWRCQRLIQELIGYSERTLPLPSHFWHSLVLLLLFLIVSS